LWEDVVRWSFLRRVDGTEVLFETAIEELVRVVATISHRRLWADGDRPVAMDVIRGEPWSSVNDQRVVGDLGYFASHGLAVVSHTVRYGQYIGPPEYFSCSEEVRLRRLPLTNLHKDGWYPTKVEDHFVVWGTGLRLYPKNLEWNLGLAPARGTAEDGRGTRLYDSSPNRLERVRQFFLEAVSLQVSDPWAEYVRWANSYDPRGGQWRNGYQYPQPWEPHFPSWALSRFGEVECCWKRPRRGAAHYYGLLQGRQSVTIAKAERSPSAMAAALKAVGLSE
jgi:hypothetical protein